MPDPAQLKLASDNIARAMNLLRDARAALGDIKTDSAIPEVSDAYSPRETKTTSTKRRTAWSNAHRPSEKSGNLADLLSKSMSDSARDELARSLAQQLDCTAFVKDWASMNQRVTSAAIERLKADTEDHEQF